MAEPQERHYNINRLNMIFAIASSVLLLALIWLVADDYTRQWKDYQHKFRELEIEKTRVKYDYAVNELDANAQYKTLESQLNDAQKAFAASCPMGSSEDIKLAAENDLLNQKYKFTKAQYDAARYRYETAQANGDAHEQKAAEEFAKLEQQLAQLKLRAEGSDQKLV